MLTKDTYCLYVVNGDFITVEGPDLSDCFEIEDQSGCFNGFSGLTTSPNASVRLTVENEFVCEKQVGEVTDL